MRQKKRRLSPVANDTTCGGAKVLVENPKLLQGHLWMHQSSCGSTNAFVEEPKYVWRSQRACRGTQGASGGAQSSCEGTSVLVEKRNVAASYGLQAITCILCAVAISFGVPLKGFLASVPPPPLATSSLSAMAHSTCNGCCTPRLALKVRPRRQRRLRHVRR